jgi:hypothetical protein
VRDRIREALNETVEAEADVAIEDEDEEEAFVRIESVAGETHEVDTDCGLEEMIGFTSVSERLKLIFCDAKVKEEEEEEEVDEVGNEQVDEDEDDDEEEEEEEAAEGEK